MSDAVRSVAELRERYRLARRARGWSFAQAAAAAGVGEKTVERFEKGLTEPLAGTALKMLTTVGLDVIITVRGVKEPAA